MTHGNHVNKHVTLVCGRNQVVLDVTPTVCYTQMIECDMQATVDC